MRDFNNSSKILFNYSKKEKDGDIEHFNNSEIKGFFDFEKSFQKYTETFMTSTENDVVKNSLYLDSVASLHKIYENKKNYSNFNKNDIEINSYIKEINTYIDEIENTKEIFEELIALFKKENELKEVLKSLNSDEAYEFKSSEKRLAVINRKIADNRVEIDSLKSDLTIIVDKYPNVMESVNKLKELFQIMDNNAESKYTSNFAIKFIKGEDRKNELSNAGNSMILSFLQDKISEDDIIDRYQFTKAQKNEEVILFKDGSIATLKKGVYFTPPMEYGAYKKLSDEISTDVVSFVLRKKPALIQPFVKKMAAENFNVNGAYVAINSYLKNEQILKNYNFEVLAEIDRHNRLEDFDDTIDKIKKRHEVKLLSATIFSGKYKDLYDAKAAKLMVTINDLKVSKDDLQDNIGKKMASFKTADEVNEALTKYINSLTEFNSEATLKKAKGLDAEVAYKTDDMVILKINNFEASKNLGSGSWCISRHETHFESYAGPKDKLQFFVFDYTKESTDKLSMIGITLNDNGTHSAAHIKNDNPLYEGNSTFKNLQKIIITENMHLFKLSENMKKILKEIPEVNKTKKIKNAL
jgi:hypothetical protein